MVKEVGGKTDQDILQSRLLDQVLPCSTTLRITFGHSAREAALRRQEREGLCQGGGEPHDPNKWRGDAK